MCKLNESARTDVFVQVVQAHAKVRGTGSKKSRRQRARAMQIAERKHNILAGSK